jgi:hypothetical protein
MRRRIEAVIGEFSTTKLDLANARKALESAEEEADWFSLLGMKLDKDMIEE